jgi:hypothetical protein
MITDYLTKAFEILKTSIFIFSYFMHSIFYLIVKIYQIPAKTITQFCKKFTLFPHFSQNNIKYRSVLVLIRIFQLFQELPQNFDNMS